ncbi:hypothetical protein EMCRGX_G033528 [Ephydatia muelleri]
MALNWMNKLGANPVTLSWKHGANYMSSSNLAAATLCAQNDPFQGLCIVNETNFDDMVLHCEKILIEMVLPTIWTSHIVLPIPHLRSNPVRSTKQSGSITGHPNTETLTSGVSAFEHLTLSIKVKETSCVT